MSKVLSFANKGPVAVGDEVSYCLPENAGETSVAVKGETWERGRSRSKAAEKVTEGVFPFVAIDDEGHPRPLPEDDPEQAGHELLPQHDPGTVGHAPEVTAFDRSSAGWSRTYLALT